MAEIGLPRSFLRPVLIIVLGNGPSHGYELAVRMWEFGLPTVDLAGIYRMLRVLEREDLVASEWEPSAHGPPRRVHTLTEAGKAAAIDHVAFLREVRSLLDSALDSVPST